MTEKTPDHLIEDIRNAAGKIGIQENSLPDHPDAEEYDFQVKIGLAKAVVEILDFNPSNLIYWLGYCLIDYGLDPDDRINALLDSLDREVLAQLDKLDED